MANQVYLRQIIFVVILFEDHLLESEGVIYDLIYGRHPCSEAVTSSVASLVESIVIVAETAVLLSHVSLTSGVVAPSVAVKDDSFDLLLFGFWGFLILFEEGSSVFLDILLLFIMIGWVEVAF